MMVRKAPGRTIGPGLLLDESESKGILPPGDISSTVMVTFCPSLHIGSREDTTGAVGLAAVWGCGATAGGAGVPGEGGEATGGEAWLSGVGTVCCAGVGGATGLGV